MSARVLLLFVGLSKATVSERVLEEQFVATIRDSIVLQENEARAFTSGTAPVKYHTSTAHRTPRGRRR